MKFKGRLNIARVLGQLLAQRLSTVHPLPEAIMPVPLHTTRMRERGFNQALEPARPLARAVQLPLLADYCQRLRATAAQSSLPAKQRRKNILGAFQVVRSVATSHIALVDGMMTTGQTLNELAKTLRMTGVERIDVCVYLCPFGT